jgi:hypothetical protein
VSVTVSDICGEIQGAVQGCRTRDPHIFQKRSSHFKIPGAWTVACSTFYTADTQILGATVQNLFVTAIWGPGFVHPWLKELIRTLHPRQLVYFNNKCVIPTTGVNTTLWLALSFGNTGRTQEKKKLRFEVNPELTQNSTRHFQFETKLGLSTAIVTILRLYVRDIVNG